MSASFIQATVSAVSLVAIVGASVIVNPLITAIVLCAGVAVYGALVPLARITGKSALQFAESNASLSEDMGAASSAGLEFRVFGVEREVIAWLSARVSVVSERYAKSRRSSLLAGALYRDMALMLLLVGVAIVSGMGREYLSSIGAIVLLMLRCLGYASATQGSSQTVAQYRPGLELLLDRVRMWENGVEHAGSIDMSGHRPVLALRNVSCGYVEGRPVLSNVNIIVPFGQAVGIKGVSGSGKSTLIKVLAGLLNVSDGVFEVDGIDFEDLDRRQFRKRVAVVPQDAVVREGSVGENVRFFRTMINDQDIVEAVQRAHMHEEVLKMTDGYDTVLGPMGGGLSGGQRQRLTIARALAGKPKVLIVDEPTSSLDQQSEDGVRRALSDLKGEVTVVLVSHNPTMLDICDQVYEVWGGTLRQSKSSRSVCSGPVAAVLGKDSEGS
jgi:ABC-type bacteriocin/lantibiotic exporter with double-glycine peptidase domain